MDSSPAHHSGRPSPGRQHAATSVPESKAAVFVVDDDVSVRIAREPSLGRGVHVETFASAQEFLDRPEEALPSCLVLDVSLPDLTGPDLQECPGFGDRWRSLSLIYNAFDLLSGGGRSA
jgi:PleD family two-component response regulator